MLQHFEVTVGEYGKMIFEACTGNWSDVPDHWKSILSEAKPLVEQLIALNDKMLVEGVPCGYIIVGKIDSKTVLSNFERIELAMKKTMEVSSSDLKEGDDVLEIEDISITEAIENPSKVLEITKKGVYIECRMWGDFVINLHSLNETFYKCLEEYKNQDDNYWLQKANELGI